MKLPMFLKKYYWWLPCCLYSIDANAWGLVTHLYFAQSLLWAMPLLDPRLQNAIKRFPELVMAGACLPDLAIISHRFRHTHLWENAQQLMLSAKTDEETAIAIGYVSHLYVDVIAHNHFVPAHEAKWFKNTVLTHITSEWAMDAHLAPIMKTSPRYLLTQHQTAISKFISVQFRCSESTTNIALQRLANLDITHSVHVSDVKLPKGVEVATHHHAADAVATVQIPRGHVEAAAEAAAAADASTASAVAAAPAAAAAKPAAKK